MSLDDPIMDGLDPRLGMFGVLLGLLKQSQGAEDEYLLQTDWFADPISHIGAMVQDHPQELLDEIVSFLGESQPSPLDKASGEVWHAIEYPKDGKQVPTGLSLVTKPVLEGEEGDGSARISLGIAYDPFAGRDDKDKPALAVTLVAQLPVLDLATQSFLPGQADEPLHLELQLRSGDGKPFSAGEKVLELTGLDIDARLFTNKLPEVDFTLRDFSMGGADPEDRDLIKLIEDPSVLLGDAIKALLTEALDLATTAASKGKTGAALESVKGMELGVLWLLGLPSPGGQAADIPAVDWPKLIGDGFGAEWRRWFTSIVTDAETLRAWLHGIYCMAHGLDVYARKADRAKDMNGAGTVADPFKVTCFDGGESLPSFYFTLAVDDSGPIKLDLGALMVTPTKQPSDKIDLNFDITGQAALAKIPLAGPVALNVAPSFDLTVKASRPSGKVLFDYVDEVPAYSISPTEFDIGLRLTPGKEQPEPFGDFLAKDKKLSFVDMLTRGVQQADPLKFLVDKLHDDAVWKKVFDDLLPDDSGLVYNDGGFDFVLDTKIKERPVAVKIRAGVQGAQGIAISAVAGVTVNPLALSLTAGMQMDDVLNPAPPVFDFTATAGPADETSHFVPSLVAALPPMGTFTLAATLPVEGFDDPLKLGLVPLTGLEGFTVDKLVPLIEAAVLDYPAVKDWLNAPVTKTAETCSWANILVDWGFLQRKTAEDGDTEESGKGDDTGALRLPSLPSGGVDVEALKKLRPDTLIASGLKEYLGGISEQLLYQIGKGEGAYKDDGIYLTHVASDEKDKLLGRYGLRLAMADIVVAGGDKTKDKKAKDTPDKTRVVLQAGKWMSADSKAKNGETDKENWLTKSWSDKQGPPKRGIHLDLVNVDAKGPNFDLGLKLISVGIDVEGTEKTPLFDIKGYSSQGVQARVYFDDSVAKAKLGGGFRVDRAALPLGPPTGPEAGTKNPVASGLLSSGGKDDKGKDKGAETGKDATPVNPEFGVQISYAQKFDAEILNDDPNAGGKVWIPVNKSFGPMFCRKLGLGFDKTYHLLVGFDGSVELGPLGVDLMDLSVGIPLTHPQDFKDYELDLGGLDLTFKGGPVEISGAFLEQKLQTDDKPPKEIVQYTGAALLKTEVFSLSGFGSYATLNGAPSMFIYAVLDKDLGGPVFFHVTALAAGFGFKRKLLLPDIEGVQDFPLVKAILDSGYIADSDDPKEALDKLATAIPPDPDSYWLAAGVRFRSFEQIETVALLAVTFGSDVTVSVLGVSTLTIPANLPKDSKPIAYAELALKAEFNPAVGVLSVEARLTSNSYVFDPDAKLTGGFAFYTWFSGEHEGDFVVTLGGYHPKFIKPSYYPDVPRLGLDLKKGDVRITGELYFALTPACLMAGGKLAAVYDIGWAKAWFTAYADFIISWKPFHYDIAMGVTIGASATVSLDLGLFTISKTFKFELGADLHIWGPPFEGQARIKFYVVTFTVHFGDSDSGGASADPIDWSDFKDSFLPNRDVICSVTYTGGLLREWKNDKGVKIHIVNANDLALKMQSMAPSTNVCWHGVTVEGGDDMQGKLGIKPMFSSSLDSHFDAVISADDGSELAKDLFDVQVQRKGFPDALWGQGKPDLAIPTAKMLNKVPAGLTVTLSEKGKASQVRHALPAMELQVFAYEPIDKRIFWGNLPIPADIPAKGDKTMGQIITSPNRDPVMEALRAATPHPLNTSDLSQTAARADTIFQSEPTYAALGQLLPEER